MPRKKITEADQKDSPVKETKATTAPGSKPPRAPRAAAKAKVAAKPVGVSKIVLPSQQKEKLSSPVAIPQWNPNTVLVIDTANKLGAVECWLTTMYLVVVIAQLRLMVDVGVEVKLVKASNSVRYYQKNINSNPYTVATMAGYAIANTFVAVDLDNYQQSVTEVYTDLTETRTGTAKVLVEEPKKVAEIKDDAEKLRTHRRGLMLRKKGFLQSTPIDHPTQIHPDPRVVNINYLLRSCPIEHNLTLESAIPLLRKTVYNDTEVSFNDSLKFGHKNGFLAPLEAEVGLCARYHNNTIIDTSKDPDENEVTDSLLKAILKARKSP